MNEDLELIPIDTKLKIKNIIRVCIRHIKIYWAYLKIRFLNEIQYKAAALAGIITQFAWGGMYIMLYSTFLQNGTSSDYTISQMCSYVWLQQGTIMLYSMSSIDKDILRHCETGQIAMELVKPIDLYSIWHAKTLGKKIASSILRLIPIVVICSMPFMGEFKLMPPVSAKAFILFIITLILSVGVMMAYTMLMYITATKNITSQGVKSTYRIIMEACSGSIIPIAFMPNTVVNVLKCTPFYYMQNVAFNIYNGYLTDNFEIVRIVVLQIIWIFVLTIIGKRMLNKELNKVIVQGG